MTSRNFHLVVPGGVRSGTTSVFSALMSCGAFAPADKDGHLLRSARTRHEYLPSDRGQLHTLDVSAEILEQEIDLLPKLLQFTPDAHVIVLIRDPYDRALSWYWHLANRGLLPSDLGFDSFVRSSLEGAAHIYATSEVSEPALAIQGWRRMAVRIPEWVDAFGDRLGLLAFEEAFKADGLQSLLHTWGIDIESVPTTNMAEPGMRGRHSRLDSLLRAIADRMNVSVEIRNALGRRFRSIRGSSGDIESQGFTEESFLMFRGEVTHTLGVLESYMSVPERWHRGWRQYDGEGSERPPA